ncbi:MAG: GGDEF domain-containing protein [Clostridia bacterium]|nr:GGDEF domain-containing protein [Clostridia bacterium]
MDKNINTVNKYGDFIVNNRKRVNYYLNMVLWVFVATGPALYAGVAAGIFHSVTYSTCIWITVAIIALSAIHLLLRKKFPGSLINSIFAITALELLLVYMSFSHIRIYITWFLVPMLSLLYCDKRIYYYASALNYVLMFITTWMVAPYYAEIGLNYDTPFVYFIDTISGLTIETIIMFSSGLIIVSLTTHYFKELFNQYRVINEHEATLKEKMSILYSMAEIYDNVNLLDFTDSTETSLRSEKQEKHKIDMKKQTHTLMVQRLKETVAADQLEEFLAFTNIKTVRTRLSQRKIISADFLDSVSGWFRAQYITVDSTLDGIPNIVIYVTRNINEEKKREEHLVEISRTDEMTGLYNRRCYEEDLAGYRSSGLDDGFVLFSIDVNGLKVVNDTKGHAAGDELIKGAAECIVSLFKGAGKVYRVGGDEFMVIAHLSEPEEMRRKLKDMSAEWKGVYIDRLSMSVGFAALRDNPKATIDDLEHLSDADMYAEKDRYYKENGIERRR